MRDRILTSVRVKEDECLARIDMLRGMNETPLPYEMMAAGLKGDFARLDRVLAQPARSIPRSTTTPAYNPKLSALRPRSAR